MNKQSFIVSAPGKIILHGEHSVVYGKKAVAASLNLRTVLTLSTDSSSTVKLCLPVIGETREWRIGNLIQLKTHIRGDPRTPETLTSSDHDAIQQFLAVDEENPSIADRISLAFMFLCKSILNNFGECQGLNVNLDSSLPLAAGLGSSASVAVCLSAALLKLVGVLSRDTDLSEGQHNLAPSDLEAINQWAFMVEKIFHGSPSGVDNCTCTYGGAVVYTSGCFNQKRVNFPITILVVNTMVERKTKEIVAKVRSKMEKYPTIINPILEAMDQIANVFENALWQAPVDNDMLYGIFEDLIDINQALLTALGVSHPKLQEIITIANKYGFPAKLTGAGGGGVAFVLLKPGTSMDVLESVRNALLESGFPSWNVAIGGPGVQFEQNAGQF